ncbi:MAG TPA: hypothetical protein ACYCC3_00320 [Candidatus Azoamicus sp.]
MNISENINVSLTKSISIGKNKYKIYFFKYTWKDEYGPKYGNISIL